MLVSDNKEYDPVYILNKMRKHKVNNFSYDPTLFKRTKQLLKGLVN